MKENTIQILLIEDESYDVTRVRNTLRDHPQFQIRDVVSNGHDGLEKLGEHPGNYDIVIMDYQISGGLQGTELIRQIKSIDSSYQIIVVTKMTINLSDFDFADQLLTAGAFWFCTKYPGDIEEYIYQPTDFIISIKNAYARRLLEKNRANIAKKLDRNIADILTRKPIIGQSKAMKDLEDKIEKFKDSSATVLISGPSGTGKELVATNIHYRSYLKDEPFITVNCGSIPSDLIESELFGYEKGAFTGAREGRQGLFEQADGGSIFLDEIGELPLNAQSKLLRVLQEGEIEKIGRKRSYKVNVRVIAATNVMLEEAVKNRKFRKDLYYRINVLRIDVPALSERREDIPELAVHFINLLGRNMGKPVPEISADALRYLENQDWPGNIREMKNVIQRVLFLVDDRIDLAAIRSAMGIVLDDEGERNDYRKLLFGDGLSVTSYRDMLRKVRRDYFQFVREQSSSDAEAAKKMGLAPPNFHRMLKDIGLK